MQMQEKLYIFLLQFTFYAVEVFPDSIATIILLEARYVDNIE
jgi:hypothetical protein